MFFKIRTQVGENTVTYATRLREKAHDCDFKTSQYERILEHLIQTIDNLTLIQNVYQNPGHYNNFCQKPDKKRLYQNKCMT